MMWVAWVVLCGLIYSQSEESVKQAEEILKSVQERYMNGGCFTIGFLFIHHIPDVSQADTQQGKLYYCGNKYRITLKNTEVVCDGNTKWVFFADTREVQINNADNNTGSGDVPANPYHILKNYREYFKYYLEKREKGVGIIKMVPLNPARFPFHTIKLKVRTDKREVEGMDIFMKDGNKLSYVVVSTNANSSFPDNFFNFDVSKAQEVIDLR